MSATLGPMKAYYDDASGTWIYKESSGTFRWGLAYLYTLLIFAVPLIYVLSQ
ncbi:hypothetical protein [Streptomyces chrestomyceticus]|uniref:hypothetical protein n=1 Tax=Streptomyces chrestomyceticus TaxID=68185 RepID=UPI00378DC9A2